MLHGRGLHQQLPWVRNVYSAMKWGKGLKDIVKAANDKLLDAIAQQEEEQDERPIFIAVAWAGNDVYGDYGYSGCRWVNQKKFLSTELTGRSPPTGLPDRGKGCKRG